MPGRVSRWLSLATLLGVLISETSAQACINSSKSRSHLVGVGPDGTFVVAGMGESEASEGPDHWFRVYDGEGALRGVLRGHDGYDDASVFTLNTARLKGDEATRATLGRLAHDATPEWLEAALIKHYHLTPARWSPLQAQVPRSAHGCSEPLRIRTPEGPVPVLDVGILNSYDEDGPCPSVKVTVQEHPASSMVFLRVVYVVHLDSDGRTDDSDTVEWIPRRRLNGVRAARRGHQAMAAGHIGEALSELDEALQLAPEYAPTRLWLMQALAAAEAPAERAKRLLATPFPEPQPCIGEGLTDPDRWLDEHAPASWRVDDSWERPWRSCNRRWSSLDRPWGDQEHGLDEEPSADPADAPIEPSVDTDVPEVMPAPVVAPLPAVADAPLAAKPASRWFEQLASLGAVAILSFAAAYRRGFRARS